MLWIKFFVSGKTSELTSRSTLRLTFKTFFFHFIIGSPKDIVDGLQKGDGEKRQEGEEGGGGGGGGGVDKKEAESWDEEFVNLDPTYKDTCWEKTKRGRCM